MTASTRVGAEDNDNDGEDPIVLDNTNDTMAEALRLTRDGRLAEASALLQRGLGGPPARTTTEPVPAGTARSRRAAGASGGLPQRAALLDRLQTHLPAGLPGKTLRRASSSCASAAASAPGGEIRHLSHANAAASRTYELYIPTGYDGEAVPLVVMLHGGTQDASDFAAGTRMNHLVS